MQDHLDYVREHPKWCSDHRCHMPGKTDFRWLLEIATDSEMPSFIIMSGYQIWISRQVSLCAWADYSTSQGGEVQTWKISKSKIQQTATRAVQLLDSRCTSLKKSFNGIFNGSLWLGFLVRRKKALSAHLIKFRAKILNSHSIKKK